MLFYALTAVYFAHGAYRSLAFAAPARARPFGRGACALVGARQRIMMLLFKPHHSTHSVSSWCVSPGPIARQR